MIGKRTRIALLSLVLAMAGFSYAIATAPDAGSRQAEDRAKPPARATLQFANPFVPATIDRDLGDAVPGKFFRRFIRAKGGIPPYHVTAGSLDKSIFVLYRGGQITVPFVNKVRTSLPPAFPVGPLRFMTSVTEFGSNGTRTEPFRLNIVADTRFRFATGPSLSDGQQFRTYVDQVGVINSLAPLTFAVTGSVFLDGVAQPSLASLGLALGKHDGVLFGQPLKSGKITFTATCTDANGNVALARDGSGPNQTYSITVDPNKLIASESFCMGVKIKAGTGANSGTIVYTGLINLGGKLSDLAGKPVILRFGNFTSPEGVFDDKGNATNLNAKGKPKKGGTTVITAKVNAKGLVVITVTNADFVISELLENTRIKRRSGSALPDDTISGRSGVAGGIVGDTSTEQVVSTTSSSSTSLELTSDSSDAGGFLVLSTISGHDDKTQLGDKWRVSFVGTPPSGTDLTKTASVQVSVGNLANTLPTTVSGTTIKGSMKVDSTTRNAVTRFSFSTKSLKGSYQTTYLDSTATGIPISGTNSTATPNYTSEVDFNDSTSTSILSGASSLTIFPKNNSWTSNAPN